jgi:hypothetical protein
MGEEQNSYGNKGELSELDWVVLFVSKNKTKPNKNKWTKPNLSEYIRLVVITN